VGGATSLLFLLKPRLKLVCSSSSDGVGATSIGAFLFGAGESLIRLVATLIFLIRSAISDLSMLDNILYGNENKKWLSTILEFMLPKVGNEEYQYRL